MATKLLDIGPPITANIFEVQAWLSTLYSRIGSGGPFPIRGYAKASLPSVAYWGDTSSFTSLIYVTDEAGGPVLAFSDGTNWRRVTDRAIVS